MSDPIVDYLVSHKLVFGVIALAFTLGGFVVTVELAQSSHVDKTETILTRITAHQSTTEQILQEVTATRRATERLVGIAQKTCINSAQSELGRALCVDK